MSVTDPTTYRKTMLIMVFLVLIISGTSLSISLASFFGALTSATKRSTDQNAMILGNLSAGLNLINKETNNMRGTPQTIYNTHLLQEILANVTVNK